MHPDHACGITTPDGKGRFKTFKDYDVVVPSISVVAANGHTPGHSSFLLSSGAEKMLVWGDTVHFHAVQLPHSEETIDVDIDPEGAVASRKRLLAETARNRWLVPAAHHRFRAWAMFAARRRQGLCVGPC